MSEGGQEVSQNAVFGGRAAAGKYAVCGALAWADAFV